MRAHVYIASRSMKDEYFYNADGEMLFLPQHGRLRFWTEFGIIDAEPGECIVIPRGVKSRIELHERQARGYVCEITAGHSRCPSVARLGQTALPIRVTS